MPHTLQENLCVKGKFWEHVHLLVKGWWLTEYFLQEMEALQELTNFDTLPAIWRLRTEMKTKNKFFRGYNDQEKPFVVFFC